MRCSNPLHIKNPYTGKNITVGCRHCDACKIAAANAKALLLVNELSKASAALFITLTYDNDHLPVVFYGSDCICRKSNNFQPEEVLPYPQLFTPVEPYKYPYSDCTGVLYYRDFQLFVKRLRITLKRHGKGNFKYFVVGEYGTVRKRPHWHSILFFDSYNEFTGLEKFICDCWKMCDNSRTLEGIKSADIGLSSYLASYVTCNDSSYELASNQFFKQKARRSASSDYGVTEKDKETLREVIRHRIYESGNVRDIRPFEYRDYSRKDNISVELISQRCFFTYFRKPLHYGSLSFNAFRLRARIVYKLKFGTIRAKELNQMDENFLRGYYAFLRLMGYSESDKLFEFYIDLFWRMDCLYQSQVLRRYMLSYEIKTPEDYFLDAFNTESCSLGSKAFWTDVLQEFGVTYFDCMSNLSRHELHDYEFKYKKKLLPKHQNSLYYDFV